VRRILQDSYGLIWIGTSNGLQKYDGYVFQTYKHNPARATSLLDNLIFDVIEDANHNIWVAHNSGVSRFERRTGEFTNYPFGRIFNFAAGETTPGLKLFIDSQGRMWAGTRNAGLVYYDTGIDNWKSATYDIPGLDPRISHSGFVLGIVEDSKGGIWVSSSEFGLLHMAKADKEFKQIAAFRGTEHLGGKLSNDLIGEIFADKDNVIWISPGSRHRRESEYPEQD